MIPSIETTVPIPKDNKGPKRKYPFAGMQVGDSFFVKDGIANRLSGICSYWQEKTGTKYMVRTVEGGIRVWRTE